jgi:hypothetical protein
MATYDRLDLQAPTLEEASSDLIRAYRAALADGWYLRKYTAEIPPVLCPPPNPSQKSTESTLPDTSLARAERIDGQQIILINAFYKKYLPAQRVKMFRVFLCK